MSTGLTQPNEAVRLTSSEFVSNPYPSYAWLREHAPVFLSEEWKGFVLTRYQDVVAAFRDTRLSSQRMGAYVSQLPLEMQQYLAPLLANLSQWALFTDPPLHTRLRGLLNRAFLPRLVEGMRPRLQALVDDLLSDAFARDGSPNLDIIDELANPLPAMMIGEMMGLPRADRRHLKRWSDALGSFLGMRQPTSAILDEARTAILELEAYFRRLIAQRRQHPPAEPDLLTALISAEEQGNILSEQELLSTCAMVLFGAHDTTPNLIGNGIWLLLQHPAAEQQIRRDFELIPKFVEEVLRLESSVQRMGRIASTDFMLHDQQIRQGQRLWLVMGAANRDPAQFSNPDAIDLARSENRHIAFGLGNHFCIGAALGRLQGQLAISGLLRKLPVLQPSEIPNERIDNLTIRGFRKLWLRRYPPAPIANT